MCSVSVVWMSEEGSDGSLDNLIGLLAEQHM